LRTQLRTEPTVHGVMAPPSLLDRRREQPVELELRQRQGCGVLEKTGARKSMPNREWASPARHGCRGRRVTQRGQSPPHAISAGRSRHGPASARPHPCAIWAGTPSSKPLVGAALGAGSSASAALRRVFRHIDCSPHRHEPATPGIGAGSRHAARSRGTGPGRAPPATPAGLGRGGEVRRNVHPRRAAARCRRLDTARPCARPGRGISSGCDVGARGRLTRC
jgi:hypothetical protein